MEKKLQDAQIAELEARTHLFETGVEVLEEVRAYVRAARVLTVDAQATMDQIKRDLGAQK